MTDSSHRFAVDVEAHAMRNARVAVESFAKARGLDERGVAELALAVSEAMFNAMDHGKLTDGRIHMEVCCREGCIEVAVETGCDDEERADLERQIRSPLAVEPPDMDLERGRGIFLMRAKTDELRLEAASLTSVRLVLVKRVGKGAGG